MSNTFLVAVDGSEGSNRAVAFAAERAKAGGANVVLAHIIEWSPYSFHTPDELAERHKRREEEIDRAQSSVLAPVSKSLEESGVSVTSVVRHGHPGETLVALAEEHDVAQIFIGRLGEARLKAILFGSLPAALVQTSPVPVTVVP